VPAGRRAPPEVVRAFVSDLDGTLLRSDGSLSSVSLATVRRLRDIHVPLIVATSRTPRAIQRIGGHEVFGTVVCANGAIVWNAELDQVLAQTGFEPAGLITSLRRLGTLVPDAAIALLSAMTMFLDERYLAQRPKKGLAGAVLVPSLVQVANQAPIAAVAVRHPRLAGDQLRGPVAAAFAGVGEATLSGIRAVDVFPSGVTKAAAVNRLLTDAGRAVESAVVFGDMPNDLCLFACSGWACAVANADPVVLEAADEIVPTNEDDGVARTIERLLPG
jgi:hydroxymethylpyrimidine pyrophosphatase-like HAD family hydrolase